MSAIKPTTFKMTTGDLRKRVKEMGMPVRQFINKFNSVFEAEVKNTEKILKYHAGNNSVERVDGRVRKITGGLHSSIGSITNKTDFTVKSEVGFFGVPERGRLRIAVSNFTGQSKMPIKPRNGKYLWYPLLGKSPWDVAPRHSPHLTYQEIGDLYYIIKTKAEPTPGHPVKVLGRRRGSKSRKLRFLMMKSVSSTIKPSVNMGKLSEDLGSRIRTRIAKL